MRVTKERVHHPDQSLRFLRIAQDAFRLERHRHSHLELTWIERGAGVRFVGDSAAPFAANDLVLLGSEVPHAWISSQNEFDQGWPLANAKTGPASAITLSARRVAGTASTPVSPADAACIASVVQFSADLLAPTSIPELATLRPLLQPAGRGMQITGDTHREITRRMIRMRNADPLKQLELLVGILRALHLAAADVKPIATSPGEPIRNEGQTRRIDRVIQWIHSRLAEPLELAAAARVAHVSRPAFSRFFKRETGKTFTDYVNEVRCAKACVLLRESASPVAVVASDCGFATNSHFNRQFLARMGQTPRQYRVGR